MGSITHRHDKHGIVWQTWSGPITMDDLVDQAGQPVTDDIDSPIKRGLCDFRRADFSVAPAEVSDLVASFMNQPDRWKGWRWAILAEQPDHVGLITLFQHRGQTLPMAVQVFVTEEAAVAWLLDPAPDNA